MPWIESPRYCQLYFEEETHADPWGPEPDTVVLIHGMAESTRAWTTWLPHLTRHFRVVRLDLPGFGRSPVHIDRYPWSVESFAADVVSLLDGLDIGTAHIVGAKTGGAVALTVAVSAPQRVRSVVSLTGPMWAVGPDRVVHQPAIGKRVRQIGIHAWAKETMTARLGTKVSEEQKQWWIELSSRTDPLVLASTAQGGTSLDLRPRLHKIDFPALMITSKGSPLSDSEALDTWHSIVAEARSIVFPDDGYHIAASRPDDCAQLVHAFLRRDFELFEHTCAELDGIESR